MKIHGADINLIQDTVQGVKTAFPQLQPFLPHSGKGRRGIGGDRQVVKSYDADILRDVHPKLLALDDSCVGDQVMAADDGSHPQIQKPWQMLFDTVGHIEGGSSTGRIRPQAVLLHGVKKGFVPHLHDMGTEGTAEIADLFMAQLL